jgi:(p)ppGpp synthase/HD superfamily hydrolase
VTTPPFAQTNLQLYSQLRRAGYGDADLTVVHQGYLLAMRLFSSSFRGSGKPLLAHLVGTASVVGWLDRPMTSITACLLHAAYVFGDFGDARPGMTDSKRARVREAVGSEIETVVARYTALKWEPGTIASIQARIPDMDPGDREILLIRLANELEDHLDGAPLYCRNVDSRRAYIRTALHRSSDVARALGYPQLGDALDRAFDEILTMDVDAGLRTGYDYTFTQVPASRALRWSVALGHYLDGRPRLARMIHPLKALVARR